MRALPFALLLLIGLPALGQSNEVAGWAMSGSIGWTLAAGDREVDFDQVLGLGASYTRRISPRFATEVAVARVRAEGSGTLEGVFVAEVPRLDLTAVTATAQWHFGTDRFDPHLGAGVAFVSSDLHGVDIDSAPAWLLNAGIGFGLTDRWGVVFDGKYIRYRPDSTSAAGETLQFDLDPFLVGAGVRYRF